MLLRHGLDIEAGGAKVGDPSGEPETAVAVECFKGCDIAARY
jgi:hypothetical protein